MGSVFAGAGVNPSDQRRGFWPLLTLTPSFSNRYEGFCPELSLDFVQLVVIVATAGFSN